MAYFSWRSIIVRLACLGVFLAIATGVIPAIAQSPPPGFHVIDESPGVVLYRKDYQKGTPDFIQVVDLSAGASIALLHGKPVENSGKRQQGMFAGSNPSFTGRSISQYWDLFAESENDPFCVTNGQFFYMPESPTPLGLPLKVNGVLLAEGFGYPQYPEKQLMLALWPDRADILPLTQENLYGTDAPDVIGGLTEEANKKPKLPVGRTFMGILDRSGDGVFETVAILTTQTATQREAARILRSFGSAKVMMLDGGGSTQLVCRGRSYIDTTRAIPQAIGVAAAPASGLAAPPPTTDPAVLEAASTIPQEAANALEAEAQPVADITALAVLPTEAAPVDPAPSQTAPAAPSEVLIPTQGATSSPPLDAAIPSPTAEPSPTPFPTPGLSTPSGITEAAMASGPVERSGQDPAEKQVRNLENNLTVDRVSLADALWLPAIISPVSIFIFFAALRRSRVS
jgi:hypothetical protein